MLITFIPKIQSYLKMLLISFASYLIGIYLIKVDNENTSNMCKICSKLIMKVTERHISLIVLVLPLFNLNK